MKPDKNPISLWWSFVGMLALPFAIVIVGTIIGGIIAWL